MKVVVGLLGLATVTLLSGVGAVRVSIRAYNATGEMDIRRDPFTLGTRVLLTCDVTGLPEGSEVVRYRWYHNCRELPNSRCNIQDRDPYYRVVKDTLLVDVTSLDQGGRYYCAVQHQQRTQMALTRKLAVAGSPAPFLYTPTSLLPEHSVLTDVQQATGRNGQQWITCRSGREGTRPKIWMGSEEVIPSTRTNASATIELDNRFLGTQHPNGLYHCLTVETQREYFSLYLRSSTTLSIPTISARNGTMWTLTSPDGRRVERYIVEFECRVRNIIFVEKYMSVSASGGTGQVATSVSCFGGLGRLYRVKVRAVSGPNISRALVCAPDGQCRDEGGRERLTPLTSTPVSRGAPTFPTTVTITPGNTAKSPSTPDGLQAPNPDHASLQPDETPRRVTPTIPTRAISRELPSTTPTVTTITVTGGRKSLTPLTPTPTPASRGAPTFPTTVTITPGNTDKSSSTPDGLQAPNPDRTFMGVGVGIGMFLLLVFLMSVVLILLVVVGKRKAAHTKKRKMKVEGSAYYNNTVVVEQEREIQEKGASTDFKDEHVYDDADAYEELDTDTSEEDGKITDGGFDPYEVVDGKITDGFDPYEVVDGKITDGFDPYEVVDRSQTIKNTKTPAPRDSPTSASAPNVSAAVNKSKKSGAKKKKEHGCTDTNNYLNTTAMEKMSKMTDTGEEVVVSAGVEEGQQRYDTPRAHIQATGVWLV